MPKIFVEKDELEQLKDGIDYIIRKGKPIFAIEPTQRIYENYDLNKKEQLVIEHIKKNPDISKEKVVDDLGDDYSRMTILNTISELIDKGLILPKQDKIKKGAYHLHVNYQNIIYSVKEDLDVFKVYYGELLENAVPIAKNMLLNNKNDSEGFSELYYLLKVLIGPYKFLCTTYITSDIFLWNERPLDDDTLHRKFALFFKTAKEIHDKLVKVWCAAGSDSEVDSPANYLLNNIDFALNESHILNMLKIFEQHGLSVWAEGVIDVLWKMSYPILPLIDSSYNEYLKKGLLEDWRKVLENNPESDYKPKTKQLPFDH